MNSLFSSGFHLTEIIDFLERSNLIEKEFTAQMKSGLLSGQNLSKILSDLKFSDTVITQISLAEFHGNLGKTLNLVENNLRHILKIRQKILAVATYPVMLLIFLFGIIFGLKNYLLPQLETSSNFAVWVIQHLPILTGSFLVIVLTVIIVIWQIFKRRTAKFNASFLSKMPIVGSFVKSYLTGYFAREWGNLISQGVELQQIFMIMAAQKSKIFAEIGQDLTRKIENGKSFHEAVKSYKFLNEELSLIVEYGALKAKLGTELRVYSEECFDQFFKKSEKAMEFIQPIVFVFVALMIVLLYAAMLLPIYQNMSQMT